MEYIVGLTLALFFCAGAAALGMDRERVFYPAVVMTVASYYLAFAVADGRGQVMLIEIAIAAVFIGAAVLGFRRNPWIAVAALGGHGVMDAFHHHLVHNAGVPPSSTTRRLMWARMAPMPRSRSGEMSSPSPMAVKKVAGVSSTCSGVAPVSPSARIPAYPRVVGASSGASKNTRTCRWSSSSTAKKNGDWHSCTRSRVLWSAYRSGSRGSVRE